MERRQKLVVLDEYNATLWWQHLVARSFHTPWTCSWYLPMWTTLTWSGLLADADSPVMLIAYVGLTFLRKHSAARSASSHSTSIPGCSRCGISPSNAWWFKFCDLETSVLCDSHVLADSVLMVILPTETRCWQGSQIQQTHYGDSTARDQFGYSQRFELNCLVLQISLLVCVPISGHHSFLKF